MTGAFRVNFGLAKKGLKSVGDAVSTSATKSLVMPAKAGIHDFAKTRKKPWIPGLCLRQPRG
jgi:hypothetical protein